MSIKPEQLTAVNSPPKAEVGFMSVSTGFDKSLVFQLLPFYAKSLLRSCGYTSSPLVVVVLPLLSLMHSQVSKLVAAGLLAIRIYGGRLTDAFTDFIEGRVTHVFGSPESFIGNKTCCLLFVENSFSGRVVALAIYEAHCSITWQVKYVKTHMLYSLRLNISIQQNGR